VKNEEVEKGRRTEFSLSAALPPPRKPHARPSLASAMLARLTVSALARRTASAASPLASSERAFARQFSTSPPGAVTPLADDAAAAAAQAGPTPCVIDFTATWCGPCRAMKAPFAALAAENPGVKFFTVDIDEDALAATTAAAGVSAVPTFTFHKGGKMVGQVQGADLDAIKAEVEALARGGG